MPTAWHTAGAPGWATLPLLLFLATAPAPSESFHASLGQPLPLPNDATGNTLAATVSLQAGVYDAPGSSVPPVPFAFTFHLTSPVAEATNLTVNFALAKGTVTPQPGSLAASLSLAHLFAQPRPADVAAAGVSITFTLPINTTNASLTGELDIAGAVSDASDPVASLRGSIALHLTPADANTSSADAGAVSSQTFPVPFWSPVVLLQDLTTVRLTSVVDACDLALLTNRLGALRVATTAAQATSPSPADPFSATPEAVLDLVSHLAELVNPTSFPRQLAAILNDVTASQVQLAGTSRPALQAIATLSSRIEAEAVRQRQIAEANLTAAADKEVCGDGFCQAAFESCSACASDCGLCNSVSVFQGSNSLVGLVRSLIGTYEVDFVRGSAIVSVFLNRRISKVTNVDFQVLDEVNFPLFSSFNIYPRMHDPSTDIPPSECFADVSFAYSGSGDLDNLLVLVDLSSVRAFEDPARLPIARAWNGTAWVALLSQVYNHSTRMLEVISPQPQQVAIFVDNTRVEDATAALGNLAALLNASTLVGNGTQLADSFSSDLLEALDTILDGISASVGLGGTVTIDTPSIGIQVQNKNVSGLDGVVATFGAASVPAVALPANFASTLGGLDNVNLLLTVFKEGAQTDGDVVFAGILDFSLKTPTGDVVVENLPEPIDIEFRVAFNVPAHLLTCRFWNFSKSKANCSLEDGNDPRLCLGDWDTRGLTKVEELSDSTRIVCRTSHLSTFSVGIDFSIAPPKVSAANFNPANAPYLWILWGSFYAFCGLIFFYAYLERRAYDRRVALLDAGLIWEEDVGPLPKSEQQLDLEFAEAGLVTGWFKRFMHALKSKHQWITILWPTGRRVFPMRSAKVTAFMATTSMAFGMMAMFAYTESQNPNDNANSLRVIINGKTTFLPLEGIYAFFITFPFLLFLSISLAKYDLMFKTLRKVAPERYRNHDALRDLAPAMEGTRLADVPTTKALHKHQFSGSSLAQLDMGLFEANPMLDSKGGLAPTAEASEKRVMLLDDGFGYPAVTADEEAAEEATAVETTALRRTITAGSLLSGGSFDSGQDAVAAKARAGGLQGIQDDDEAEDAPEAGDFAALPSDDLFTPEQVMVRHFADQMNEALSALDEVNAASKARQGALKEEPPSDPIDVDDLERKMRHYRFRFYATANLMLLGSMVLALTFQGSLTEEAQIRYMKGTGEFVLLSAIFTAPLVLLIVSGRRQWYMARMKQKYSEEEWRQRVAVAAAAATAMVMTQAMMAREIGRALRDNFDISII